MRKENAQRLKDLEEAYYGKRDNASVGKVMRERMGFKDSSNERRSNSPRGGNLGGTADFDRDVEDEPRTGKQKKTVKILDEGLDKENHGDNERVPRKTSGVRTSVNGKPPSAARGRSRSASRKEESPVYDSPRQKLYEAKFEKYLANKEAKQKQEKKLDKLKKEDFERYIQGPSSPSKKNKLSASKERSAAKYEPESLIPQGYEDQLLQKRKEEGGNVFANSKDPFKRLGVSNEDKMTFFLLKWIFNAIKRDSSVEDAKLLGKPYITKGDLVKQLSKNDELMNALGYDSPEEVA